MVNRTVLYDLAQQNHLCLPETPLPAQRALEQTRAHGGDLLFCSGTRWKEGNPVKKVRQPTLRLLLFRSDNIFSISFSQVLHKEYHHPNCADGETEALEGWLWIQGLKCICLHVAGHLTTYYKQCRCGMWFMYLNESAQCHWSALESALQPCSATAEGHVPLFDVVPYITVSCGCSR